MLLITYAMTISASADIVVTNNRNAILREIDIAHLVYKFEVSLLSVITRIFCLCGFHDLGLSAMKLLM